MRRMTTPRRVLVRLTPLCAVALALLGCGGLLDGPPFPDGPPPEPAPEVPTAGDAASPQLLVLQEGDEGCSWTVHQPGGASHPAGRSASCPLDVRWAPDGTEVVARTEDEVITGPWPLGDRGRAVKVPERIDRAWRTPDGELRAVALLPATVTPDGDGFRYTAGERRATATADEHNAHAGEEELLAVFFALDDAGTWKELGAEATHRSFEGMTDPLEQESALNVRDTGWASFADALLDNDAKSADTPQDLQNEAIRAAVGCEEEDDQVGFLPFGDGGLLYRVVFGDTPHPMPHLSWCAERTCTSPVRLPIDNDQLTITLRGDLALVAQEYQGADARVFRAGSAEPVLSLPEATHAAWLPSAATLDGDTPEPAPAEPEPAPAEPEPAEPEPAEPEPEPEPEPAPKPAKPAPQPMKYDKAKGGGARRGN